MTDTADPRIALMQKWNAENPELLAQAGLSASAGSALGGANDHFIAEFSGRNQHRSELLKIAGVDTAKHPQSGQPHTTHKAKKGKSKKGKGKNASATYSPAEINGLLKAQKAGIVTTTHHAHNERHNENKKQKHHNPYNDVDHEKLKIVLSHAMAKYEMTVKASFITLATLIQKTPNSIAPLLTPVLRSIQAYYNGQSGFDYDTVIAKLKEALTGLKTHNDEHSKKVIKFEIRHPPTNPDNKIDGAKSLLLKLINITTIYIRTHIKEKAARELHGFYELNQETNKLNDAKKNCVEIKQALAHQIAKHQEFMKNTIHTPMNRPGTNGGAVVRMHENAEHAFEPHGTFSMSSPYDT
jgi:hypothetical protein